MILYKESKKYAIKMRKYIQIFIFLLYCKRWLFLFFGTWIIKKQPYLSQAAYDLLYFNEFYPCRSLHKHTHTFI